MPTSKLEPTPDLMPTSKLEPTPENYTKRFRTKRQEAELEHAGCYRYRHRVYGWSNLGWQGRGAPRERMY